MRFFASGLFKLLGLLLGLALVAGALTPWLLRRYLPPEKVRELLVSKAQKALRREVRLEGVSWSLLKGLGLQGLSISERPDFSAGSFASARSFNLKLRWSALLERRVVVDSVALEGLRVALLKGKDGSYNFSDLLTSSAAAAPKGSAPAPLPFALDVSRAQLSEGELRYQDQARGDDLKVSLAGAQVADFRLSGFFPAELSARASGRWGGKPLEAGLSFSGEIDLGGKDPAKAAAAIKKFSLEYESLSVAVSGRVQGLSRSTAELKLALAGRGGKMLEGEVSGVVAWPRGQSNAWPELEASLKADLEPMKPADLAWAKLPEGFSLPAMRVESKLRLKDESLSLESLRLKIPAGRASLSGKVSALRSAKPEPDIELSLDLDLPEIRPQDLPWAKLSSGVILPAAAVKAAAILRGEDLRISSLALKTKAGTVEVSGQIRKAFTGKPAPELSLLAKCRSFALAELTRISPETREMSLKGGGFFALGLSGKWPRPLLEGKLQFKDLGATVSGLALSDFNGTVSFDEKSIHVPNLKGRLAEGSLEMDLTVKNYHASPEIDLRAGLTQFDLGKFLAAKAALASKAQASAKPEAPKEPEARRPIAAKGRLTVGRLLHPHAEAKDLKLDWDLSGITADMKSLDGWARLHMAGGRLSSLGKMATQSKVVKVLVFPLMIFQKIGSIGGIKLFPDFNNVSFSEIAGDYAFKNGLMTLKDSHLYSDVGNVTSKGDIDLPAEKLNLTVTAQVANIAPMDVEVGGSFSEPKSKLKLGKLVGEQAKQLVEPAKQLLENIFTGSRSTR